MRKIISLLCLTAIIVSSCSTSSKIQKYTQRTLLKDSAIQHAHTGIVIYEPATGKYWYDYQGEKYFVPASNTKLATCYVAMKYLGDSLPGIQYQILNDSTVAIEGMGDPSFLHPDFNTHPVFHFLKQFKSIKVVSPAFDDFMGSGWSWGDYPYYYAAQRSAMPIYGNIATLQWEGDDQVSIQPSYFQSHVVISEPLMQGFQLFKPWSTNQFFLTNGKSKSREVPFIPNNQTLISLLQDTLHAQVSLYNGQLNNPLSVKTQPLDSLLKNMMHRSDNFYAEQNLLMVSRKLTGKFDDRAVVQKLLATAYKDMPQKPGWVDGSGLSRYDLFSPKDFVYILNKMKDEFGLDRMKVILPTGGEGTISSLYHDEKGFIYVKTGTLNGVVALSGYLYTKKNKLLIFSVLVNNHHTTSNHVRKEVEKFIEHIRGKY